MHAARWDREQQQQQSRRSSSSSSCSNRGLSRVQAQEACEGVQQQQQDRQRASGRHHGSSPGCQLTSSSHIFYHAQMGPWAHACSGTQTHPLAAA